MAAISDSLMNSLATWLKQIRNHSPLETETPPRDSVTSGTLVGHHAWILKTLKTWPASSLQKRLQTKCRWLSGRRPKTYIPDRESV